MKTISSEQPEPALLDTSLNSPEEFRRKLGDLLAVPKAEAEQHIADHPDEPQKRGTTNKIASIVGCIILAFLLGFIAGRHRYTSSGSAGATGPQVWVNTDSGQYFRASDEYYGKTRLGKYMSEGEAINAGYHQ